MIDIHTHILPGIDDGSESFKESIEILKNASLCGVTDVVVTPHFILGSDYNCDNKTKRELLKELKNNIKKENINIKIHLGNEIFIDNEILKLIKKGQITTINSSKYFLFELPISNNYKGLDEFIFEAKNRGLTPILAHPERYAIFKKNPKKLFDLVENGVLLQCNIGSFFNKYNKDAKKLVTLLIKHKAVSFIASDTHSARDNLYERKNELIKTLKKYLTDKEIDTLLIENPRRVLNKEKIKKANYIPIKKTLLGKWK